MVKSFLLRAVHRTITPPTFSLWVKRAAYGVAGRVNMTTVLRAVLSFRSDTIPTIFFVKEDGIFKVT